MALTPGSRLGVYDITAQIGEGGMGQVYRATDTRLKRQVAIKMLPPALAADGDRLARVQREAEVLASLNHPNIAAIHGLEGSGGTTALVMELVEGEDLSQRIRDLKPANIKMRADGTVKVLDFGLAKAIDANASSATADAMNSPTITSPAMTQAGMILGTAAYMAPEQARGKAVDRRADIWAFGAVLFEMLSGQRAFRGEDVTDTLALVVRGEPGWDALPPTVPARVRQVLRACLQKDARQRLGDMQSVRLALEGAFETAVAPAVARASAVPPLWRRALPVAAAVVLTATIVAGAAWSLMPPPAPSAPLAQFQIQPPDGLALDAGSRQIVALSPDGTRLIFSAGRRLFVRAIGEVEATPIQGIPEGTARAPYSYLVFSPDGKSVVFWGNNDGTLKRVPVAGGQAVTIAQGVSAAPSGMTWGADGIVFADPAGILRVPSGGGTPERLVQLDSNVWAQAPQMLPGGEVVMFTLAKGTEPASSRWDTAQIVAQSLASGERRTLIRNGSDARYLPTGHIVYAVAGTVYGVAFDLARSGG